MRVQQIVPSVGGHALARVANAIRSHAPSGTEFVVREPDLIIYHVIGRQEHVELMIDEHRKPYAVVQYCLVSTKTPEACSWLDVWSPAKVVWSYLDLRWPLRMGPSCNAFKFYRAPLGVDSSVFTNPCPECPRPNYVMTSGLAWTAESVREVAIAVADPVKIMHLGRHLGRREIGTYLSNIPDSTLSMHYQNTRYVSGLRRKEGFELPAAEGLLCGARPILFDQPHYRQWYGDSGIYITEGNRESVVHQLEGVFRMNPQPVTDEERAHFVDLFSWERVTKGFWNEVMK